MKFLADVNIPQSVIKYLVKSGHDVMDYKKVNPSAKDVELVKSAQSEDRIILTLDKDFISLTQFPKYKVATIIIRLQNQNPQKIVLHLDELLKNQSIVVLNKSLTIIKERSADSHEPL